MRDLFVFWKTCSDTVSICGMFIRNTTKVVTENPPNRHYKLHSEVGLILIISPSCFSFCTTFFWTAGCFAKTPNMCCCRPQVQGGISFFFLLQRFSILVEKTGSWLLVITFFHGGNLMLYTWQFFVTFLGWLSEWPFQRLSDLQLGDKKVTLNHLVDVFRWLYMKHTAFLNQPWSFKSSHQVWSRMPHVWGERDRSTAGESEGEALVCCRWRTCLLYRK